MVERRLANSNDKYHNVIFGFGVVSANCLKISEIALIKPLRNLYFEYFVEQNGLLDIIGMEDSYRKCEGEKRERAWTRRKL